MLTQVLLWYKLVLSMMYMCVTTYFFQLRRHIIWISSTISLHGHSYSSVIICKVHRSSGKAVSNLYCLEVLRGTVIHCIYCCAITTHQNCFLMGSDKISILTSVMFQKCLGKLKLFKTQQNCLTLIYENYGVSSFIHFQRQKWLTYCKSLTFSGCNI